MLESNKTLYKYLGNVNVKNFFIFILLRFPVLFHKSISILLKEKLQIFLQYFYFDCANRKLPYICEIRTRFLVEISYIPKYIHIYISIYRNMECIGTIQAPNLCDKILIFNLKDFVRPLMVCLDY